MCQHLDNLHIHFSKLVFANDQWLIIQNRKEVKGPFKIQDRSMDCIQQSTKVHQDNKEQLPLLIKYQRLSTILSKRSIKILLPLPNRCLCEDTFFSCTPARATDYTKLNSEADMTIQPDHQSNLQKKESHGLLLTVFLNIVIFQKNAVWQIKILKSVTQSFILLKYLKFSLPIK